MSAPVPARFDRGANLTAVRSVWPGTASSGDATEGDAAIPAGSGRPWHIHPEEIPR